MKSETLEINEPSCPRTANRPSEFPEIAGSAENTIAIPPGACLLCGSSEISWIQRIKGYTIVDCRRCGLRYLRDRIGEDAVMRYYREAYFHPGVDPSSGYEDYFLIRKEREKTFRLYLSKVLPHLRRFENVLDIGCGAGYFLSVADRRFTRVFGIDVSPEALSRVNIACELRCGEFRSGLYPAGFADVIMLCDVIEHVYHLREFLGEAARVLHPDGVLCLVTPNRTSVLGRISGRRNISYKLPEHVSFFDPQSIARALGEAGLEIIDRHSCGQYATVDYVARRLGAAVFKKRNVLPLPGFIRRRTFYVNTGSMLILARRRSGEQTTA